MNDQKTSLKVLNSAMEKMAAMAQANPKSNEAMQFAQAALYLSHAKCNEAALDGTVVKTKKIPE